MGKRPQLDLGEITFGRIVSSDSSGGITFNLICRNKHDCIWTKLHWVELSQVTARGSPLTYLCRDRHDCIWTKLPWVEF